MVFITLVFVHFFTNFNIVEAIDIILRQSPDLSTILNRKLIRREYLFRYLDGKGITVTTPATKSSLVNKILKIWDSENTKQTVSNCQSEIQTIGATQTPVNDVNLLATKFTEWFYSIFNKDEPIGEEHFWQDCIFQLNLISDTANSTNTVESSTEAVNLLFNTKNEHGLYLNLNLTPEGIKGKMDNHGLVLVFACGTLHTKDNCVGVFEQMFALARDPFSENNWKIKNSRLLLRSKPGVSNMPTLENSSLNNMLLISNR